jgi:hypothetical protein
MINMADSKASDNGVTSATEHNETNVPMKQVDEKNIALPPKPQHSRQVSEWEALQIAAVGDNDTIDREIAMVEADLQAMNIQSTWFKPQIRLKDPRHFTWLLVGMIYFFQLRMKRS